MAILRINFFYNQEVGMQTRPGKKNHTAEKQTRNHSSTSEGIQPDRLVSEIRKRAQEIYQERGNAPGTDLENWLKAEGEIKSKYGITS
jgi:hypothetical protein